MTFINAILKKVQSKDSFITKKYTSPPPELDEACIVSRMLKKKKKHVNRYPNIVARVDASPPPLQPSYMFRNIGAWSRRVSKLYMENVKLLTEIKRHHFLRGKVDCRWKHEPHRSREHYEKRRDFLKRVEAANKRIYQRVVNTKARVVTTQCLESDWQHHRRNIIEMATLPFVLFPPDPKEEIEAAFITPPGIKRPRVRMTFRVQDGACLGSITVELFTDICPLTCRLFTDLLDGDEVGYGYVGTTIFRKVPFLYWSGGDVVYDNGFGCYAQVGRNIPIGAENYHFPHSMPGLLSMRMTPNDEMCGIFNITFKALPQLDLKNVVFGRIVRPCKTYETMRSLGSALSTQPVVLVSATRRRQAKQVVRGRANERLLKEVRRWKEPF